MIINLDGKITKETVDTLIQIINNSTDDTLVIYLRSNGGDVEEMEVLIDVINDHKHHIILKAYGLICSAAFELFFKVTCKRHIIGGCLGMYHSTMLGVRITDFGIRNCEALAFEKYLYNHCSNNTLDVCDYLNFTHQQKQLISEGKEVWFQPSELQQLLNISENKNKIQC